MVTLADRFAFARRSVVISGDEVPVCPGLSRPKGTVVRSPTSREKKTDTGSNADRRKITETRALFELSEVV